MFLSKSRVICTVFILIFLVIIPDINAQSDEFNYDELKVPKYELPDPLILQDGNKVLDKEIWIKERRPEIIKQAGLDFVFIDTEYISLRRETLAAWI